MRVYVIDVNKLRFRIRMSELGRSDVFVMIIFYLNFWFRMVF